MKYEYWFGAMKGISSKRKIEIRGKIREAKDLFFMSEIQRRNIGLSDKEIEALSNSVEKWNLEKEYERVLKHGVKCISYYHPDYPENLKEIFAPPYMLHVKGRLPDKDRKVVAMVGARECSDYGRSMAKEFAEVLASAGIQIVSGMARGVDSVSQRSAIAAGGTSFAVLGCGVDICYPREEIELYQNLINQGGILSEHPLGTEPLRQHFPARNRIISGLADAVLVIEAKEKSGSLITADMALEQGKDVYALPGPINSALSRGCNGLIKQGADILLSPEKLLEEWGIFTDNWRKNEEDGKILLETPEKLVYSCLDLHPQNLGQLMGKTKLSIPELLDVLVRLQVMGYVKEISKNYYVKLK